MTKQEIIEQLKSLKSHCEDFRDGEDSVWAKDVEALDAAIEALGKQAASEWVPVSERLPDKNGTYLITVSSYDETASIEYIAVDHCNSDGGFLHFETKKNPKAKSGEVVTAWMPCPEPYKENK